MFKNPLKYHCFGLFFAFFLAFCLKPDRGDCSDFQSSRTMGLGGAGHANPLLNDAIYMNPSFTSFIPYRSFGSSYLWHGTDQLNEVGQSAESGTGYNLSILDGSKDALFQAGVGFTKRGDSSIVHIGASKSVIDRLGFGLGAKIILPAGTNDRHFESTLSFTGIATDWFQAAIMVDNLFQNHADLGYYREWILGTKINAMSIVSLFIDPHWVPALPSGQNWGYEAGLEFTVFSDFYLRFGEFRNSLIPFRAARGNGFGAGLGWLAPKISVDYGISRTLSPVLATAHQVGLTIFF